MQRTQAMMALVAVAVLGGAGCGWMLAGPRSFAGARLFEAKAREVNAAATVLEAYSACLGRRTGLASPPSCDEERRAAQLVLERRTLRKEVAITEQIVPPAGAIPRDAPKAP
jgi:hypothetical protein